MRTLCIESMWCLKRGMVVYDCNSDGLPVWRHLYIKYKVGQEFRRSHTVNITSVYIYT